MKTNLQAFTVILLSLFGMPALRADKPPESPQALLGEGIASAPLGTIPTGWKALDGDWALRLDQQFAPEGTEAAAQPLPITPELEKQDLLPRVLGTDLRQARSNMMRTHSAISR